MNVKNLIYHGAFVLVLSSLLAGVVHAQEEATTFPLGPMPKLIVFILTIVLSIIIDSLIMLGLVGGLRLKKALIMAIPWAFLNIYWFDYIAPAVGMTFFTLRFVEIGYNYWIGINWVVVFLLDFLFAQGIFRFARGAAPSPNWQDTISVMADIVLPAILFIVLPMLGLF